ILATGNYCFFNVLTIALCVMLLDDAVWPARARRLIEDGAPVRGAAWPLWVTTPVASLLLLLGLLQMFSLSRIGLDCAEPLRFLARTAAPLRLVNGSGLFAVMTTTRPEIVVEGSADGDTCAEYEFRWKPGDLSRPPPFVQPHQPRLDWQMWFAAL